MTIRRLLKNSSLPPEGVNRLVAAYQKTLRTLDLVDRHDPVAEIVANKVIEMASAVVMLSKFQSSQPESLA